MTHNKHIIVLFQLVLLLFVTRISCISYNFSDDKKIKKISFSLMDKESSDNSEEKQNSEDENKNNVDNDDLFSHTLSFYNYTSLTAVYKTELKIRLSNSLTSIFIPPPEQI